MWIMVAGPYRSGSSDPAVWADNFQKLNAAAVAILEKGHVPIIGVNMALPIIDAAGQESYERIMLPLSLCLTERCDAVLRIEGVSGGADVEVDRSQGALPNNGVVVLTFRRPAARSAWPRHLNLLHVR
jgi:hypothetical protein